MERRIKIDRRFTLGEYKYMTLEDELSGIPEALALNSAYMSSIRYLQLLSLEIAYRRYIDLITKYPHTLALDKAIESLEKIREEELKKIKQFLAG